ncbi:hypothetical protein Tco_0671354, partial [Tanacetum coccineum]
MSSSQSKPCCLLRPLNKRFLILLNEPSALNLCLKSHIERTTLTLAGRVILLEPNLGIGVDLKMEGYRVEVGLVLSYNRMGYRIVWAGSSLKNAVVKHGGSRDVTPWKRIEDGDVEHDDDDVDDVAALIRILKFKLIDDVDALSFGQSMVFDNFNVQSGMDATGVPTDMLTLNSTVRIFFRNPATFFGVHVSVSPVEIHYFQLKLASGY